jgi:hypothetical protein
MPLRHAATFLRQRAKRLREIAALDPNSPLSPQLIGMAADLDERANALEHEMLKETAVTQADLEAVIVTLDALNASGCTAAMWHHTHRNLPPELLGSAASPPCCTSG